MCCGEVIAGGCYMLIGYLLVVDILMLLLSIGLLLVEIKELMICCITVHNLIHNYGALMVNYGKSNSMTNKWKHIRRLFKAPIGLL